MHHSRRSRLRDLPLPPLKTRPRPGRLVLATCILFALSAAVTLPAADPPPLTADLPLHGETVLHLATVQESREVLAARDTFIRVLSRFDRQSRLRADEDVELETFLTFVAGEARPWSDAEREKLAGVVEQLRERLEPFDLPLPKRIRLVKTTGREEGNAAYCRDRAIILPRRYLDRPAGALRILLTHELFHILSRGNEHLRQELYAIVGFQPCAPLELPESLRDRKLTNPDAPRIEHTIRIDHDGRSVTAAPILYANVERYESKLGGPFFRFLEFRLMVVEQRGGDWRPAADAEGKPILVNARENASYLRQIGRNTDYIIHPDEILADNFVHLVEGRSDLKTPRIVDEMKKLLK